MKVLGVIAEYNPLHYGHLYHLQEAQKRIQPQGTIAILGSSFLQRGEPSIVCKWARTQMALAGGVDLVLELPIAFACRSAWWFASGSIQSLEKTGIVTHLAFGAETNNLPILTQLAEFLNSETPEFKVLLQKHLQDGLSYPKSRDLALNEIFNNALPELNQPNNILALSFLRILQQIKSNIKPILIQRIGDFHASSSENNFLSATGIRKYIKENDEKWKDYVPPTTVKILEKEFNAGRGPVLLDNFSNCILAIIRRSQPQDLKKIIEMEPGLENRIYDFAQNAISLEQLIKRVKTKRYTWTRIQRVLTHILLNFKHNNSLNNPQYLRVLGFNHQGRELLKIINQKSTLPVITKFARDRRQLDQAGQLMLDLEIKATDLYALGYPQQMVRQGRHDYYQSPILDG